MENCIIFIVIPKCPKTGFHPLLYGSQKVEGVKTDGIPLITTPGREFFLVLEISLAEKFSFTTQKKLKFKQNIDSIYA